MKIVIQKKSFTKTHQKINDKVVRNNPQNYQIKKLQKLKEEEDHTEITVNLKR